MWVPARCGRCKNDVPDVVLCRAVAVAPLPCLADRPHVWIQYGRGQKLITNSDVDSATFWRHVSERCLLDAQRFCGVTNASLQSSLAFLKAAVKQLSDADQIAKVEGACTACSGWMVWLETQRVASRNAMLLLLYPCVTEPDPMCPRAAGVVVCRCREDSADGGATGGAGEGHCAVRRWVPRSGRVFVARGKLARVSPVTPRMAARTPARAGSPP